MQNPVQYYFAPTSAFATLSKKVQHQWTAVGATQAIGWVDFETTEAPDLQTTFEATADVVSLGTAMHPLHPKISSAISEAAPAASVQDKELQASVQNSGITSADNMMSALSKLKKRHGGFKVTI